MQEEGFIGIFYERKHRELSRVHGFMKELLATADSEAVSADALRVMSVLMLSFASLMIIDLLPAEYDGRFCERQVIKDDT